MWSGGCLSAKRAGQGKSACREAGSGCAQAGQDLLKREEVLSPKDAACAQALKQHREALERVAGLTAEESQNGN